MRFDRVEPPVDVRIGRGDRVDQGLGVGVARRADHRLDIAGLDDAAGVEHHHRVGDLVGGGEVVGDVDQRDAGLVLQPQQQLQDGGAQRGVDHRDRFVGQDDLRIEQQRAGDHDALALPAGKLVRVAAKGFSRAQADPFECRFDQRPGVIAVVGDAEAGQRREQRMIDGVERVEHVERVLKHRLHLAAERLPAGAGEPAQIGAAIGDAAFARRLQSEQQPGQRGLAAAAFADHGGDRRPLAADGQAGPGERHLGGAAAEAGPEGHADAMRLKPAGTRGQAGHAASARWQATSCPGATGRDSGVSLRQRATADGQR